MRIDQLTFSRFLAALAIVIFHYGQAVIPFNNEHVTFLFKHANLGVSYFFVLSGFIMIVAYGKSGKVNTTDYLKNRFARIYPLIALSVLPYVFRAIFIPGKNFSDVLFNLSNLQAWIPGKATVGNYPLWSLSVEVFFYICFPFLINHLYKKISFNKLALLIVSFWIVSLVVQNYLLHSGFYQGDATPSHDFIYYFPLMHLSQFMAGNLAGLFFINKTVNSPKKYDLFIVLILIVLVLILKYPLGIDYHNGFLAVVFVPLILFQAQNTAFFTQLFCKKPFVFLGEISFAMYVLQVPLFETGRTIMEKMHLAFNPAFVFYGNLTLLIIASSVCHIFIELPLRNRIKNIRLRPVIK